MEKMIGQANVVGEVRNRQNHIGKLKLPHPRTLRVYYGVTVTGALQAMPGAEVKGIVTADYPHLDKGAGALLGINDLHKKATTSGYRVRDTGFRPEKTGGFGSAQERRRVKKLRKEKELKRNLQKVNINAGQLWLMISSAYHSQELLEKPVPKKPSFKKTSGFMSSKEVRLMQKQRKKNEKAFAPRGNIYRY